MLLTVLVLSSTLLSVALIAGLLMLFQIRQAGDATNSAKAVFAADSGIEWWFYNAKGLVPSINTSSVAFNNGQSFEIINLGSGKAKVIGQAGNSKRAFLIKPQGYGSCQPAPDVMLVIDRSSSFNVSQLTFRSALKDFINDVSSSSLDQAYIGISTFADIASPNIGFLHLGNNSSSIKTAIDNIDFLLDANEANVKEGIDLAQRELSNDPTLPGHPPAVPHDRDDTTNPDFMILITDSVPTKPGTNANAANVATAAAAAARSAGTTILVIGIDPGAEDINMTNFYSNNIASTDPNTGNPLYYRATDYGDLSGSLRSNLYNNILVDRLMACP